MSLIITTNDGYKPGDEFTAGTAAFDHIFITPEAVAILSDDQIRSTEIHELMHMWQREYYGDVGFLLKSIDMWWEGEPRYLHVKNPFKLDPNRCLLDYSIEQQASIIEEYFTQKLNGNVDPLINRYFLELQSIIKSTR